ncbi:MAG TPA: polysaccharide biosynthesis/export family protein [Nostocaceae cyanobacterium]|nr:polysaccharide biosynthesis/export family protein [Nostocaceae cyanobacterium]
MSITPSYHLRAFSALGLISLQVSFGLTTTIQPVLAQALPTLEGSSGPIPVTPSGIEFTPANTNTDSSQQIPAPPSSLESIPADPSEEISPAFQRYILGPGDFISVAVQRPPGPYRLGIGDSIGVAVQRFPDLSFQAAINPEGNIIVPLLGTVSLQGLTLKEAETKIYTGLNRYVVNPIIVLSLSGQRQELSFQAAVNPEGNIVVPQVGLLSVQGLSVQEAQEKIRLAVSRITPDPVVVVSLTNPRPVQVTVSGEVFRPGIYTVNPALPRIAETLQLAGGSTLTADLRQVQIRRKTNDGSMIAQNINLYAALQNGGSVPNLRLQDGDAIIIPKREVGTDDDYDRYLVSRSTLAVQQIRVRVLNYAAGGITTQTLPNGSTFVDALTGVNLDTANLRDIALVRFDPERGKAITQRLDGKKALSGDVSQNVPLQDNDVIVVGRNLIGRVTNLLNTITQPFFNIQGFLRFFQNFGGN